MHYDYINHPNAKTSNGYNGYIFHEDFLELHIYTNSLNNPVIVVCDKNKFNLMYKEYWCVTFTGKKGYLRPQIYCNILRKKYPLKDTLFPKYSGIRVEYLDNNCLNFLESNIKPMLNGKTNKEVYRKNKKGGNLPVGMWAITDKKGKLVGYTIKDKYFGISEFKDIKIALNAALEYYKKYVKDMK